ncbi:MAG TPA: hypothetical protein VMV46_17405 [Thermoanaerobaculia bacterium]|nr:hypothetical protein [Thermoanaerobaculia bacterium]
MASHRGLLGECLVGSVVLLLFALPLDAQPARDRSEHRVVLLQRVAVRGCEDPGGWSNLFFGGGPSGSDGAVALFAELGGGERVEVLERQTTDGGARYTVRSSESGREHQLELGPVALGECATAELPLDRLEGEGLRGRVQVMLSDGFVYGRVAEHREGILQTRRGPARLELHPRTRQALRFDRLSELQMFVDLDLDGVIHRTSTLTDPGDVRFSDDAGDAFRVGDERFVVESISADGLQLELSAVDDLPAPFRGFRAPAFTGVDLEGDRHQLADHGGRIVVIELWSTACPFSESVRPQALRLAAELEAIGGAYLSMARETDEGRLRAHLDDRPRPGILLVRENETWERWNPQVVTPLYYVIAADGTVLLREMGVTAVQLAAAVAGVDVAKLAPQLP